MHKITLTSFGIAGAIQAISNHFDEQIEKAKKPKQTYPDFPYTIDRSFEGLGEIELAIEVTYYRPAEELKGRSERDPSYDGGAVSFGDATEVATGKTIELTPAEWEQVETSFWN